MKTIFVVIFWLRALSPGHPETTPFEVVQTELGGIAPDAGVCAALPMDEVLKPVKDAAANIAKGLVPEVVCGIAAPTQDVGEAPPVRSEPGHPDQPQRPSGAI